MPNDSLTAYIITGVATAIVSALAFLVRNAFGKVESTLSELGAKLDGLKGDLAKADGDRRVLEARFDAVQARLDKMERELRDLSEGVAR